MKILKIFLAIILIATGTPAISEAKINGDKELKTLFIDLGKAINPAVVNIFTTQVIKSPYGGRMRGMPMDPFEDFFEQFMGPGGGGGFPPREQRAASLGSGFIIDESGIIVTNNHVIQNATDIQVQLTEKSKKKYKATVIGKDERTDIALIKIKYDGKLSSIPLGDSDKVEVGEWVAAFGNPFGHGHSMTKGIISAKERDVDVENAPSFPFLQTDASINPGNSGGPLVNTSGEVIGVNSAIDARAQGIGFAIPINVVKKLLPELKSKGRVTRGFLGVVVFPVDERVAKELNLKEERGVVVTAVNPGSPAEKAGVQPYDVIVEYNSKSIDDAKQLINAVGETKVGDSVTAKIIRDGKQQTIKVVIAERNEGMLAQGGRQEKSQSPLRGQEAPHHVGVTVTDINPLISKQLNLPPTIKKGAVIIAVKENSVADQAGLQVGDLIYDVNQKFKRKGTIPTAKEINEAFRKGSNSLLVGRGGNTMLVFLTAE